jgi:tRNA G18 (ribose-2'-O)-methylase SpoU
MKAKSLYLILENIRSAENVGAIFRTADAASISKIFLVGTTPAPIDRFGRKRKDIEKSALGAEESVLWKYVATSLPLLKKLKKEGFLIVAIEQSPQSIDYKKVCIKQKTVFVLGSEVSGISKKVLSFSDVVAEIPMRGKKESLNVSVVAGISLFRMTGL